MTASMWMVRAGQNSAYISEFLDSGHISVGYDDVGRLSPGTVRPDVIQKMREAYPSRKEARNLNAGSQLYRFHAEMQVGDEVVTYDAGRRTYFVAEVKGPVEYRQEGGEYEQYYRRSVEWRGKVARDRLAVSTRNTLGSTLTIFRVNEEAATEIRHKMVALDAEEDSEAADEARPEEEAELDVIRAGMHAKASEFIEDLIAWTLLARDLE